MFPGKNHHIQSGNTHFLLLINIIWLTGSAWIYFEQTFSVEINKCKNVFLIYFNKENVL